MRFIPTTSHSLKVVLLATTTVYTVFGESVFMLSNSKVIGSSQIGDNVIVAANCYIKDTDIPSGSFVFGESPHLTIKTGRLDQVREYAEKVFDYE